MSVTYDSLDLVDARRIIAAATRKADELGKPMNIAVVCSRGYLLAFERMAKAIFGSIDIAQKKAWTATAFNVSTEELAKNSQSGGQFFGIHVSNNSQVMIFAGGIPLHIGENMVGAIGVSGGSQEEDQAVAEAGAAALLS